MSAGLRPVEPGDPGWPSQLGDLGRHAPRKLWVVGSGELRLLALRSVAIVGARLATSYGVTVAGTLAADLSAAGWVVVSGGAFGIDSAAHRGALASGGATVAVMAGGADVPVPVSHAPLLGRIADKGLLVSEMPPGSVPHAGSFLQRNRLIAALTRAVVVVEAGNRSGALNTANWGSGLGRHVLAVPGPVSSEASRGTHRLIRERQAVLVQDAREILEMLEPFGADAPGASAEPPQGRRAG